MIRVIIYDEACEFFNIEKFLKDDVQIIGYFKNDVDYYKSLENEINVYDINNFEKCIESIEYEYIVINSRYSNLFYEKVRKCNINPNKILDIKFFYHDSMKESFKEKILYCKESNSFDFDLMFLGRTYIGDNLISKYFDSYINISNQYLDMHYDYHLLYYLIKNNKINKNINVGIFTNYSMLYKNIDLIDYNCSFVKIFEDILSVHNHLNNTYFDACNDRFKYNFNEVFKNFDLNDLIFLNRSNISSKPIEEIKYLTQIETINYKESNIVAFKMNKNIMAQKLKLLYKNDIRSFFIIPPVHKEYRTYINNTLKKEFYMVLNKNMNDKLFILDYFNLEMDSKYFSSPSNLNIDGCEEFLKVLKYDIKNKFSNIKVCNDL